MEQKLKKSIQDEISLQASILGNHVVTDPEYMKALMSVVKLNGMLVEDEKLQREKENQERRFALEEKKAKDSKSLERAKLNLEKAKLEHQIEQDKIKVDIEKTNQEIQLKNIEVNLKKIDSDLAIAKLNADTQRASDRSRLILTLIGTGGGLLLELGAIIFQYCLGTKSVALEYIDNGITPKKTSEAIRSLNDFVKKKH